MFSSLRISMIKIIEVAWHYYAFGFTLEEIPLYMNIAFNSEEVLQRLVSVTSDILISTFACYYTAIILISIFFAILDFDLYSCYLSTILTSDIHIWAVSTDFSYFRNLCQVKLSLYQNLTSFLAYFYDLLCLILLLLYISLSLCSLCLHS